jgi:hypothetical protein
MKRPFIVKTNSVETRGGCGYEVIVFLIWISLILILTL